MQLNDIIHKIELREASGEVTEFSPDDYVNTTLTGLRAEVYIKDDITLDSERITMIVKRILPKLDDKFAYKIDNNHSPMIIKPIEKSIFNPPRKS